MATISRNPNGNRAFWASRAGVSSTLVVAGLLLVVVGVVATTAVLARSGGGTAVSSTEMHTVSKSSFDITVIASGELEAQKQTEIRSGLESMSSIAYVADEGTVVRRGDLLVELNADTIRTNIDEELLRVESARSDLIAAENSLEIQKNENDAAMRQSMLRVELAELEYHKWERGDLPKRRQELALAIEKADRNLELFTEQYLQTQSLFERGFESSDKLKQDEIRYIEAQAEVKRARLTAEVFEEYEYIQQRKKLESDVEEAKAEVERVVQQNASRLASKEADLINRRRQLQIREERLANHQRQLEASRMTAPNGGLVVYASSMGNNRGMMMIGGDGPLQIGRNVRPNELLIILPDTERMVATVRVHESNAGRIRPGQQARVRIDAAGAREFTGRVQSVSVLAESGGWRDPNLREYTVKILLDQPNSDESLKPSMRADAEILLGRVDDVLAVPSQAIFRDGPVSFVYARQGARYMRTPVRVGRRSSTMAEVAAGLGEGVSVLLREPTPGEVMDREFDPAQLAALGPSPEEQEREAQQQRARTVVAQGGEGQQRQGQQMDLTAFFKDNAGKKIDDLELPDRVKQMLRAQFPDGTIPENFDPSTLRRPQGGGGNPGANPGAAAAPAASAATASPNE